MDTRKRALMKLIHAASRGLNLDDDTPSCLAALAHEISDLAPDLRPEEIVQAFKEAGRAASPGPELEFVRGDVQTGELDLSDLHQFPDGSIWDPDSDGWYADSDDAQDRMSPKRYGDDWTRSNPRGTE